MAQVAENDLLRITFVTRTGNQLGLVVTHHHAFQVNGFGPTDTEIAGYFDTQFAPLLKAIMPPTAEYRGTLVQIMKPLRYERVAAVASAGPGVVTGNLLGSQLAGVVSVKTGIGDRNHRGRNYFPFPSAAHGTTTGACAPVYITALTAVAAELLRQKTIGTLDSCKLEWVVYSRKLDIYKTVNAYTVRSNWGTQRRRSQINRGDVFLP